MVVFVEIEIAPDAMVVRSRVDVRVMGEAPVVHAEVTELLSNVIRGHTEETRNF